jgi:hypothetical protein
MAMQTSHFLLVLFVGPGAARLVARWDGEELGVIRWTIAGGWLEPLGSKFLKILYSGEALFLSPIFPRRQLEARGGTGDPLAFPREGGWGSRAPAAWKGGETPGVLSISGDGTFALMLSPEGREVSCQTLLTDHV